MIKGMMESLKDKHSVYFDATETQEFNQTIQGNFEGI
jgi:C-terminal processing protease CtpA/Prc